MIEEIAAGKYGSSSDVFLFADDVTLQMATRMAVGSQAKVDALSTDARINALFRVPRGILSTERTEVIESKEPFWYIINLDEPVYRERPDYWRTAYEDERSFRYDSTLNQAAYIAQDVRERSYFYRVITTSGPLRVELRYIQDPHDRVWGLAAILSDPI